MPTPELVNAGDGLLLAIPLNWRRNAVVVFSTENEGAKGASVVVRRESLDPRITLQQYTDGVLVELARTIPGFTLIDRRGRPIGGENAISLIYTFQASGTNHVQTQTCLIDQVGSVLSIVTSSTREHAQDYDELFEQILNTARLVPVITSHIPPQEAT